MPVSRQAKERGMRTEGGLKMRRVALLAFVSALTGFIALPAAATPSFPPVPTYEDAPSGTCRIGIP